MGRGVHSLKLTNAGVPIAIVTYFNSFRFFQKVHNIGIKSGHGENAGHIRASFKISRISGQRPGLHFFIYLYTTVQQQALNIINRRVIWLQPMTRRNSSAFISVYALPVFLVRANFWGNEWYYLPTESSRAGSGVDGVDPLLFLAGCRKRRLNQALPVLLGQSEPGIGIGLGIGYGLA